MRRQMPGYHVFVCMSELQALYVELFDYLIHVKFMHAYITLLKYTLSNKQTNKNNRWLLKQSRQRILEA